ncbi:uncharacterized protein BJX67DRAFT_342770 [Aspergillus lucknowensis]|uniref:Secreted protein n=1 Tax=Aspergillus lucknowensis TaxID=176173 RepID=A0ABR4M4Z1_9EURO
MRCVDGDIQLCYLLLLFPVSHHFCCYQLHAIWSACLLHPRNLEEMVEGGRSKAQRRGDNGMMSR